jgi:hypothetical protein
MSPPASPRVEITAIGSHRGPVPNQCGRHPLDFLCWCPTALTRDCEDFTFGIAYQRLTVILLRSPQDRTVGYLGAWDLSSPLVFCRIPIKRFDCGGPRSCICTRRIPQGPLYAAGQWGDYARSVLANFARSLLRTVKIKLKNNPTRFGSVPGCVRAVCQPRPYPAYQAETFSQ